MLKFKISTLRDNHPALATIVSFVDPVPPIEEVDTFGFMTTDVSYDWATHTRLNSHYDLEGYETLVYMQGTSKPDQITLSFKDGSSIKADREQVIFEGALRFLTTHKQKHP
jgi:hypothetical protein